jgi:hypothetical protein
MPVTVDPSANTNGVTKPGSKAKSKNQFRRAKNKLKKEQNGAEPKVKVSIVVAGFRVVPTMGVFS